MRVGACPRVPKEPTRRRWLLLSTKETCAPRPRRSLVCGGARTEQTARGGLRPAGTCRISEQATTARGLSVATAAKETTTTALRLVLLRRIAEETPAGLRLVWRWSTAKKIATRLTRVLRARRGIVTAKEPARLLSPGVASTKKTRVGLARILRTRRGSVAAKGTTCCLLSPCIGTKKETWAALALRCTWLSVAKQRRLGTRGACAGSRAQSTENSTALARLLLGRARIPKHTTSSIWIRGLLKL